MTTSTIKIERSQDFTSFSFNLLASRTNFIIDTPTVYVSKDEDYRYFISTDDFVKNIEKKFLTEDDADLYAMKILLKEKKHYINF